MTSRNAGRRETGRTGPAHARGRQRAANPYSVLCAVFGAIAAASLVWLWSLTLADFNPPNWIRVLGVIWLPIGLAGSVTTGILGRRGPDRSRVAVGLVLTVLTFAGFIALISTAE